MASKELLNMSYHLHIHCCYVSSKPNHHLTQTTTIFLSTGFLILFPIMLTGKSNYIVPMIKNLHVLEILMYLGKKL
jgi:hypothetical protein